MPSRIYIYGNAGIWPVGRARHDLDYDLNDFLQDRGVIAWNEHTGPGWNVEVLLNDDIDVDDWIPSLLTFLRQWGVPDGPLFLSILCEDGARPVEHRRVVIP